MIHTTMTEGDHMDRVEEASMDAIDTETRQTLTVEEDRRFPTKDRRLKEILADEVVAVVVVAVELGEEEDPTLAGEAEVVVVVAKESLFDRLKRRILAGKEKETLPLVMDPEAPRVICLREIWSFPKKFLREREAFPLRVVPVIFQ